MKPEWLGRTSFRQVEVSDKEVYEFARLSGDESPIHVDSGAARLEGFAGGVVHGMLLGSYVSASIGMDLPGPGGVLKSMNLDFRRPAIYPCWIEIQLSVVKYVESVRLLKLDIEIKRSGLELLVTGSAQCVIHEEGES